VRITHIPTGITVSQQDEKSQIKNREKAMRILRARLYEHERQKQHDSRSHNRKLQIGTGDRSGKIRTYNYPQNRVTDHRIGFTVHNLEELIKHGMLDEIINALMEHDKLEKLSELESGFLAENELIDS